MEREISGFAVDFEVDTGKSFLVLTENEVGRHEIVGFQIEMIAKNKIPGVAGLNIREKDLERRFYYDISGLISLANFFTRQKVAKADFIKILQNITGALTGCKNFLLDDKCFVISENLIFINPESLEVFLIYIPFRSDGDIVDLFKSFVINLVVKTANIETDDNFVQKLLVLIKEERLCISEFNAAVRRLEGRASSDGSALKPQGDDEQKPNFAATADLPEHLETPPAIPNHKPAVQFASVSLALLTIVALIATKISKILAGNVVKFNDSRFLWGSGATLLAIIVFTGSVMYTKFKRHSPKGPIKETDSCQSELFKAELYINQQEIAVTAEDSGRNETRPANVDETVVLISQKQPVLVGSGDGERIVISKDDFVIGRNLDTCDYAIHNKSIGRAHGRIQNNSGKFYIFDLDSKNGTFLNGERLISNKQYELKSNDRVSFADLQYCFKLE